MTSTKGYYCLIQYCPDRMRLEAATIGVLLFCPERMFLKALTAKDNSRIQHFFGREGHDWSRINSFKAAIKERLEIEQSTIQTITDLETFIALRANQLQITPPRSMRVTDPEEDLKRLFDEAVGSSHRKQQSKNFRKSLEKYLLSDELKNKVCTNIEVAVPAFNKQIKIPYGYQNGRFNLIQPVPFQAKNSEQTVRTACRYAVEGLSMWNHKHPRFGKLQLIVVGKFTSPSDKNKKLVQRIFDESNVHLFPTNEIEKLVEEIRKTGKEIQTM